jgi:putative addiction module component (TIGR02574 family)
MGKKKAGNPLRLPPQARTEKGRLPPAEEGSRGKGGVIALDRGNPLSYLPSMAAPLEFRSLPVAERLQLVGAIWDSIAEDQHTLHDHPSVVKELRERKALYLSNPKSGVTWEAAKKQIRSAISSSPVVGR